MIRVLFVKPALGWPRTNGTDLYCYYIMKALVALGAEVSLATFAETDPRAIEGLELAFCGRLSDEAMSGSRSPWRLSWLQERFRSFWGISLGQIESVRRISEARRAEVVVAFGLPALPLLGGADQVLRVWANLDEWVYHHLSLVRLSDRSTWHHLKSALIKGLYERAYASRVDRIWVVSETDRRAARWFAGMPIADLLPNGVDIDFYRPMAVDERPRSAVFWGRLDFEPNIDALAWFSREVWPKIILRVPDARFTIIGSQPTSIVEQLAKAPGISLQANVDDLRPGVCQNALVVLPMISGGGIKNKLLEGAAMGRAIVCTPRACMDLHPRGSLPLVQASNPGDWVGRILELWDDDARRIELGAKARHWVSEHYTWAAAARGAVAGFRQAR